MKHTPAEWCGDRECNNNFKYRNKLDNFHLRIRCGFFLLCLIYRGFAYTCVAVVHIHFVCRIHICLMAYVFFLVIS